jgi:hypothetical protein
MHTANGVHQRNGHVEAAPAVPPGSGVDGSAAQANGRGPNGRFGPGNKFSRGNEFFRRLAALRKLVVGAVSDEQLRDLVRALYRQALAGDVAAAKVLLSYLVGRPQPVVSPDHCDLDEAELARQYPSRSEASLALHDSVDPAAFAAAVRENSPAPDGAEALLAAIEDGRRRRHVPDQYTEEGERQAKVRRRK